MVSLQYYNYSRPEQNNDDFDEVPDDFEDLEDEDDKDELEEDELDEEEDDEEEDEESHAAKVN